MNNKKSTGVHCIGLILMILFVLSLTSCRIYGLHSRYHKLSAEHKSYIINYTHQPEIQHASPGFIYIINAENLASAMKNYPYNLVYEWNTRCPSEACISPSAAYAIAKEKGYKLWVVLEYYDEEIIGKTFDVPIYSINHEKYYTNLCSKYTRLFMSDLGYEDTNDNWGRFYLFERDKFVEQQSNINDFATTPQAQAK